MKGTVFTQRHQKTAGVAGGVLKLGLRTSDDVKNKQTKQTGMSEGETFRKQKMCCYAAWETQN